MKCPLYLITWFMPLRKSTTFAVEYSLLNGTVWSCFSSVVFFRNVICICNRMCVCLCIYIYTYIIYVHIYIYIYYTYIIYSMCIIVYTIVYTHQCVFFNFRYSTIKQKTVHLAATWSTRPIRCLSSEPSDPMVHHRFPIGQLSWDWGFFIARDIWMDPKISYRNILNIKLV